MARRNRNLTKDKLLSVRPNSTRTVAPTSSTELVTAAEWPGVFVSSTVYDLIDVRAELERTLRDLRFSPLLSDRLGSDFTISHDRDSIATCLENVRKCTVFVCVLSQRYGPRLGSVGFKNVSATHLEYLTAREAGLPIHFYVRDRLATEYGFWRKAKDRSALRLSWVKDTADFGLFELIDEHQALASGSPGSNWYWPFRDSVELRERLAFDLRRASRGNILRHMIETHRLPILSVTDLRYDSEFSSPKVRIRNFGSHVALNVRMRSHARSGWEPLGDMAPPTVAVAQKTSPFGLAGPDEYYLDVPERLTSLPTNVTLRYRLISGEVVETEYPIVADKNRHIPGFCVVRGETKIVDDDGDEL